MPAQSAFVAHQAADAIPRVQKPRCEPPADVTGRAGQQDEFIFWHGFDYTVPDLSATNIAMRADDFFLFFQAPLSA